MAKKTSKRLSNSGARPRSRRPAQGSGGLFGKLLPVIVVVVVGALAIAAWQSDSESDEAETEAPAQAATEQDGSSGSAERGGDPGEKITREEYERRTGKSVPSVGSDRVPEATMATWDTWHITGPITHAMFELGNCIINAAQTQCRERETVAPMPPECNHQERCDYLPGFRGFGILASDRFDYVVGSDGLSKDQKRRIEMLERHCSLGTLLQKFDAGRLTRLRERHKSDVRGCRCQIQLELAAVSPDDGRLYPFHVYWPPNRVGELNRCR